MIDESTPSMSSGEQDRTEVEQVGHWLRRVLANYGGWKGHEGDEHQLQQSEPHQAAVKLPNEVELHRVTHPEVRYECKAGDEREHFWPPVDQAGQQFVAPKLRRRFGKKKVDR